MRELRPKTPPDSEKITINLGYVDLGHIDLMVEEGSIPIAPTSSEQPSATSSTSTDAVKQSVARRSSTSACATTPARISKP